MRGMLQHDYILGLVQEFGKAVSAALRRAFFERDGTASEEVEASIGELIDLDAQTAMALSPASLVTMIQLSGVGESVAGYVAWTLGRLADAYDLQHDSRASIRRSQAEAVAQAFGCDLAVCPEEFEDLERDLEAKGVV